MWYLKGHSFEQKTPTLGNVSLGSNGKILTSLITPKVNFTISPKKTEKNKSVLLNCLSGGCLGGGGG